MGAKRLDVVVQLKARSEEKAQRAFGEALGQVAKAKAAVEEAHRQAQRDHRGQGSAAEWMMVDAARGRSLQVLRSTQKVLDQANVAAEKKRALYTQAHQATEVVRRVADVRRAEDVFEENKKEARTLDELTLQRFVRGKTGT